MWGSPSTLIHNRKGNATNFCTCMESLQPPTLFQQVSSLPMEATVRYRDECCRWAIVAIDDPGEVIVHNILAIGVADPKRWTFVG